MMQEQNLYELTSMIDLGSEFYAQAKVYVYYLLSIIIYWLSNSLLEG